MRALFLRDRRPFDEVLMSHLPGLKIFKTKFHHFLEGNLASELEGNLASELEGNMASELEGNLASKNKQIFHFIKSLLRVY